jgi:ribonucleoside-diphosphate reductase subunit M2
MSDSPVKRLNLGSYDKENAPVVSSLVDTVVKPAPMKPIEEAQPKASQTPSPKDLEAEEPLLQENPHRFVLFPIKYHEVSKITTRHA